MQVNLPTLANNGTQLSLTEKSLVKQYSRRRIFLFVSVVTTIAFISVLSLESENQLYLIDDYAKIILPIILIIMIVVTWRNQALPSMKRVNMIGTIMGVLILLFGIMALVLESGNPDSIADDFPAIILGIFFIINGVA